MQIKQNIAEMNLVHEFENDSARYEIKLNFEAPTMQVLNNTLSVNVQVWDGDQTKELQYSRLLHRAIIQMVDLSIKPCINVAVTIIDYTNKRFIEQLFLDLLTLLQKQGVLSKQYNTKVRLSMLSIELENKKYSPEIFAVHDKQYIYALVKMCSTRVAYGAILEQLNALHNK